jgi:hypothetical protein
MWSKQKLHACFFAGDKEMEEDVEVEYNWIGKNPDVEA